VDEQYQHFTLPRAARIIFCRTLPWISSPWRRAARIVIINGGIGRGRVIIESTAGRWYGGEGVGRRVSWRQAKMRIFGNDGAVGAQWLATAGHHRRSDGVDGISGNGRKRIALFSMAKMAKNSITRRCRSIRAVKEVAVCGAAIYRRVQSYRRLKLSSSSSICFSSRLHGRFFLRLLRAAFFLQKIFARCRTPCTLTQPVFPSCDS
jgi:hypothetical protein